MLFQDQQSMQRGLCHILRFASDWRSVAATWRKPQSILHFRFHYFTAFLSRYLAYTFPGNLSSDISPYSCALLAIRVLKTLNSSVYFLIRLQFRWIFKPFYCFFSNKWKKVVGFFMQLILWKLTSNKIPKIISITKKSCCS